MNEHFLITMQRRHRGRQRRRQLPLFRKHVGCTHAASRDERKLILEKENRNKQKKMWGTVSKRQRGTMKTTFIKGSKILGPWEQPSSAQTWEMELRSFSFSMKAAHNILKPVKLLLGSG